MIETKPDEEHGGATSGNLDRNHDHRPTEAKTMLSVFASVGATHFDVTLKDERTGAIKFDKGRTVHALSLDLPSLLQRAEANGLDIIVRPVSKTPLIQLDDLSAEGVQRVKAFAFAIIETSRGSFQAWFAVEDATEDTARRLKAATKADVNASGAVRLCGTKNRKLEHAPDFPTVRLVESQLGRMTTTGELQKTKLLQETTTATTTPPRAPSAPRFKSSTWPDYGRCLNDAPARNKGEGVDISRADWNFALIAADRGFSAQEIAGELMNVSEKAKKDGIKYAERTAQRAVEKVATKKAGQ